LLAGLTKEQAFIVFVFSLSIVGTLFFWEFRLSFVFIGSGVLFLTRSVDLPHFIEYASLDVILFLIGMMIVVAAMRDSGIFRLLAQHLLAHKNIGGLGLFVLTMLLSAAMSGLTGEVTSIIIMAAIIFDICDRLEVNPTPLIISSVLTTNIGSASTLLGNPIGILIALRAGLTFEDFLLRALPLSFLALMAVTGVLVIWYRDYIKDISAKLRAHKRKARLSAQSQPNHHLAGTVIIFVSLIVLIALHKRLEMLFGMEGNDLLIILPVIFSGIILLYRRDKARYYVETQVEWSSLLFFMFLFAQAGVLQSCGVAQFLATKLIAGTGGHPRVLSATVLLSSGLLSAVLDNTVVTASFIPVVKNLHLLDAQLHPLWWAMLFGACFGGNITAIGSTANIVALSILEKEKNIHVGFLQWLKVGLLAAFVSMAAAYVAVTFIAVYAD